MARGSGNHLDAVYAANYMGHLYRAMGRPQDALTAFERAIALSRAAHLPVRLAFNLLAQAALYMDMGRIEDSLEAYRETVETGRRTGRPDHLAATLSLYADALVGVGRPGEAVPFLEEAAQLLGALATDKALEDASVKLALARELAGLPGAADDWREVVEVRKQLGDAPGTLEALEHEIRLRRGEPEIIPSLLDEALALAQEAGIPTAEARIRNSRAIAAWRRKDLEAAEAEYREGLERLRQAGEEEGLGVVLNGLGAVLNHRSHPIEARTFLLEALDINRRRDRPGLVADGLVALAAGARSEGNDVQARTWYEDALEARRSTDDRAGEGWVLLRLAELSGAASPTEQTSEFLSEALEIALEVEDAELEAACRRLQDRGSSVGAH
jgi:tetratricopeptide (TPR) repeat protein